MTYGAIGHSLFGKTGNNPWCEYGVDELAKKGLRERIVKVNDAPDAPFAIGEFALVTEPIPGRESALPEPRVEVGPKSGGPLIHIQIGAAGNGKTAIDRSVEPPPGLLVKRVKPFPACNRMMLMREDWCPYCGHKMPEWRRPAASAPARRGDGVTTTGRLRAQECLDEPREHRRPYLELQRRRG